MLGKLMKHEWKSTYKVGGLMLILIVGVTFFGWLAFQSPMWQAISGDVYYDGGLTPLDMMSFVTLMLYVFMLVGTSYGTLIYLGVHFYKTMYTDEGYLTHTLPVTKNKLLVSKILISGIWYLIITIAIAASAVVLIMSLFSVIMPDYMWSDFWELLVENWGEFVETMRTELGFDIVVWGITMFFLTIIGPFSSIIILFGAISLGQLFTKHRGMMAIVSYLVIMVLTMVISSLIQSATSVNLIADMSDFAMGRYVNISTLSGMLQSLVTAALLYMASYLVISKKLNME